MRGAGAVTRGRGRGHRRGRVCAHARACVARWEAWTWMPMCSCGAQRAVCVLSCVKCICPAGVAVPVSGLPGEEQPVTCSHSGLSRPFASAGEVRGSPSPPAPQREAFENMPWISPPQEGFRDIYKGFLHSRSLCKPGAIFASLGNTPTVLVFCFSPQMLTRPLGV